MRFDQIVGHSAVISALKRCLATGRVANAYLLYGPEGVGKRAVASAFTAALVCPFRTPEQSACGNCHDCRMAALGRHPDVLHVEPSTEAGNITIQQVRALRQRLSLTAGRGTGWKAAVVERSDRLTPEAANALLKILEEPPGSAAVVLLSPDMGALPATVVSRSVRMHLGPVAPEAIVAALVARGLSPEQARLRAGLAKGAVGPALAGTQALEAAHRQALHWLQVVLEGEVQAIDQLARQMEAAPLAEVDAAFTAMIWLWRDVAAWSWTGRRDLSLSGQLSETMGKPGSRPEPGEATQALANLLTARGWMLEHASRRLVLNWAWMNLRRVAVKAAS